MKNFISFLFLFFIHFLFSQNYELTNPKLINYYNLINEAEINIVKNDLKKADIFYEKAFNTFEFPHAKDLYNSMIVSLKLKNKTNSIQLYKKLKCLKYQFEENFVKENFENSKNLEAEECSITIDFGYKKTLDSLVEIDQFYRKLSKGNYKSLQKEITKNDSIASTSLLKLIQKKGFPNEYDLGLESSNKELFQNFYFIIWHQLAINNISPQRVNFTKEMVKALNNGKITPENASFLIDLNNGTQNYSTLHFEIQKFYKNNGSTISIRDHIENNEAIEDCCYVHKWFLSENRDNKAIEFINNLNFNRKSIGLCSIEDQVNKTIYYFNNNKIYIFPESKIIGSQFDDEKQIDWLKTYLVKINIK